MPVVTSERCHTKAYLPSLKHGRGLPNCLTNRCAPSGFVLTATLAGLDKFFKLLADWNSYISPIALQGLPVGEIFHEPFVGQRHATVPKDCNHCPSRSS